MLLPRSNRTWSVNSTSATATLISRRNLNLCSFRERRSPGRRGRKERVESSARCLLLPASHPCEEPRTDLSSDGSDGSPVVSAPQPASTTSPSPVTMKVNTVPSAPAAAACTGPVAPLPAPPLPSPTAVSSWRFPSAASPPARRARRSFRPPLPPPLAAAGEAAEGESLAPAVAYFS